MAHLPLSLFFSCEFLSVGNPAGFSYPVEGAQTPRKKLQPPLVQWLAEQSDGSRPVILPALEASKETARSLRISRVLHGILLYAPAAGKPGKPPLHFSPLSSPSQGPFCP